MATFLRICALALAIVTTAGCETETAEGEHPAGNPGTSAASPPSQAAPAPQSRSASEGGAKTSMAECNSAAQCVPIRYDTDGCPDLQGSDPGHIHVRRGGTVSLLASDSASGKIHLVVAAAASSPLANGHFSVPLGGDNPGHELQIAERANIGEYAMMIINLDHAVCPPLDFVIYVEPA